MEVQMSLSRDRSPKPAQSLRGLPSYERPSLFGVRLIPFPRLMNAARTGGNHPVRSRGMTFWGGSYASC